MAAHAGGAPPADRGRRAGACTVSACAGLPARAAGLVSFRGARRALAAASAGEGRRGSLGRREVQLRGAVAQAGGGNRGAGDRTAEERKGPRHAQALSRGWIGGGSAVLAAPGYGVQTRMAKRLGLIVMTPRPGAGAGRFCRL